MNGLKAVYRGRAIGCAGHDIYRQDRRAQWLEKLTERGAKQRASFLYQQLAALKPLRHEAKRLMVKEARRQPAYPWLMSVPQFGSVSVAQLLAIVGTPHQTAAHSLARDRDRKSTRLNSSHQIISYAVFCLKKKKKTTIT